MPTSLTLAILLIAQQPADDIQCPGATTIETNACMASDVAAAQERLDRYLEAARERLSERSDEVTTQQFEWAQSIWSHYVDAECGALYQYWRDGTIRNIMSLGRRRRFIDERTHTVWQDWLQYADSTPPILPEPAPTRDSNMDPGPIN